MSLAIDSIIRVSDSIEPNGVLRRDLGIGLFITTDTQLGTGSNRIAVLSSFQDALNQFTVGSQPYLAAQTWFAQSPLPKNLIIGRWINAAASATLKGGVFSTTLSQFQAITNGSFNVVVDGVSRNITALNLSSANSFTAIATAIQTAITTAGSNVTVVYNPVTKSFVVTSATTGATSTLTYFSPVSPASGTDLSAPLALTLATGAQLSQGAAAESISQAFNAIINLNNSPYFVSAEDGFSDATVSELSALIQSFTDSLRFMFSANTNDAQTLITGDTTSESAQLFALQPQRTWMTWSATADRKAVSAAARMSSVNFDANNGLITLMFKTLPGTLPDDLTTTQQTELDRKRVNYYANFSGDPIYAKGTTFNTSAYIDTRYALDWFVNAVQVDVFDLLVQSPRIAQTDEGNSFVVDVINEVCQQAVRNGMVTPGYVSEALKADIIATTGNTEFDGYLSTGYLVWNQPVSQQSQSDRDQRKFTAKKIWLKSGGAIQSGDIAIVLEN